MREAFGEDFAAGKRALVLTSATLFTGGGRPWVLQMGLVRNGRDQPHEPAPTIEVPAAP